MSNTTPEPTKDDGTATTDGRGKPSVTTDTTETSPVAKPQGRGKPS
jgi:hypothetical protein